MFDENSGDARYVYGSIENEDEVLLEGNIKKEILGGNYQEKTSFASKLSFNILVGSVALIVVVLISAVTYPTIRDKFIDTNVSKLSKPNVVFILVDDLGWNDLNALSYASPFLATLSQKSVRLTQYYSQEICTPARASLLTGRYPISVGMQYGVLTSTQDWGMNTDETLLPEVLRDHGDYKTYMLGKWNLGHSVAEYLPTARGFDQFLGYMDGQNNYWSKSYPSDNSYVDFMYADTECYNKYNGSDSFTYSSTLYRDKAVAAISAHDYASNPLFMYFSAQAVHDPFIDSVKYPGATQSTYYTYESYVNGDTDTGLTEGDFSKIMAYQVIPTFSRRVYTVALALLDRAVEGIYTALESAHQLDNSYIIVVSDNGGCYQAGAKNGDLRGTKGSLFEGGTKVDAFIYSPLLTSTAKHTGLTYDGLMHVSDWFPTILGFAGISSYRAPSGYTLDGVDQSSAIAAFGESKSPREFMLYNAYINVAGKNFDMYSNGSVAVRNSQYKLMHTYSGNPSSVWYAGDILADDDADDDVGDSSCGQAQAMEGTFGFFLFDLVNDPYETNNLYGNENLADVKASLYAYLNKLTANEAKLPTDSPGAFIAVTSNWAANDAFVQPWNTPVTDTSPRRCSKTNLVFSPVP